MNYQKTRQYINFIAVSLITVLCICSIFMWKTGVFSSLDTLQKYVLSFGILAPIIFIVLQTLQVVIPFLPCAVTCIAANILFGPFRGFCYNYIGLCLGSIIAFALTKRYGKPFLANFFSEKTIAKYETLTDTGKFTGFFTVAIILPVFPDDFLCYLAGTTNMSFKKFITIILLGKPFVTLCYSLSYLGIIKFL